MAAADRVLVASDTFDSSISGNWTNGPGNADPMGWVTGGFVEQTTAADCAMCYTGASFAQNQWSKTVVQQHSGGSYGSTWAIVRMNSTNGQCYFGQMRESGDAIRFALWEANTTFGTSNLADSGAAAGFTAGDYVLLEVKGAALELFAVVAGGAETSRLTATDSTSPFYTGTPGLGANSDGTVRITAWEGGNLGVLPPHARDFSAFIPIYHRLHHPR